MPLKPKDITVTIPREVAILVYSTLMEEYQAARKVGNSTRQNMLLRAKSAVGNSIIVDGEYA